MVKIPKILQKPEIRFVLIEKGGKKPFQQSWQNKIITHDNPELLSHISSNGNYGVLGGGPKKLVIIDFDNEQLEKKLVSKLPETFTVKTGSGRLHLYFFSDEPKSFKIFDAELNTLADVQGQGKQVIGPGSIHPNGNAYEVFRNISICFIPHAEIKALMMPHDKKPKKKKELTKEKVDEENNTFIDDLLSKVNIEDVLQFIGIDTSKNPTECPFHSSKGGKCFGFEKKVAHCFHCDESWNIISLIKDYKKVGAKEAIELLANIGGLTDELKKSREQYKRIKKIFTVEGRAEQLTDEKPIFYDKTGIFWMWNDTSKNWEISDEVDILNMIEAATGKDIISSKNRTEIINSLKQKGRILIPKDLKPTWIQFKDKIYDIDNGENFLATPDYFVTNQIPWDISGDPQTPEMDKIFEQWVGKDQVQTLYEILAYCMIPDYPINRLFCFIGGGMNGKSKFLELLRKFIGTKNICSTELDTLLTSRFEVTRLHKKLVCMMGETNFNELSKTSILKKLTGGDIIGFEYKNKTPFEDINYAKVLIATNNLPTTTDKTIGFYRRWMIIDFPNQFTEEKDILKDIPEEEYNNLATNCLIILNKLLSTRKFTNEGSVEERMKRYEEKSNFLEKFLDISIKPDTSNDGYITSADFARKFKSWCKENHHREMSDTSIGLSMKKIGYESVKRYFNWLHDGKGGQMRVWEGISWKN